MGIKVSSTLAKTRSTRKQKNKARTQTRFKLEVRATAEKASVDFAHGKETQEKEK